MSQDKEPTRKIVSRGRYAQIQGLRAGVGVAGFCLLLAAAVGLVITAYLCIMALAFLCGYDHNGWEAAATVGYYGVVAGTITFVLAYSGMAAITHTVKKNNVVPFTNATASNLPAEESLVRASEEPPVAPETTLLRAATENTTTPPEQLARSSTSPD